MTTRRSPHNPPAQGPASVPPPPIRFAEEASATSSQRSYRPPPPPTGVRPPPSQKQPPPPPQSKPHQQPPRPGTLPGAGAPGSARSANPAGYGAAAGYRPPKKSSNQLQPLSFAPPKTSGRRRRSSKTQSRGWLASLFALAIRLYAYYAVFAALFLCGSGPFTFNYSRNDSRSVCRSLAYAKQHLVPLATPLVQQAHEAIDPYTGPYVRAVSPYASQAYQIAKPQYDFAYKHGTALYKKHVDPVQKHVYKRGRQYADPHIKQTHAHYKKHVQPHVDTFHRTVKPYRDIYDRDISPYVVQAQAHSLNAAVASQSFYIRQVHPRLIQLLKRLRSFWRYHLNPALRRAFRLYVQPLVNKATLRVFGKEWRPIESDFVYESRETIKAASGHVADTFAEVTSKVKDIPANVIPTSNVVPTNVVPTNVVPTNIVPKSVIPSKVIPSKVIPTVVKERIDNIVQGLQEAVDSHDELDGLSEEELDNELGSELDRITEELESWERGMSRLIKDEIKSHRDRIAKGDNQATLEEARKASVATLRKYLREARGSFDDLMDAAKFEQSVDDFEGWDKGLGVRVKLFAEDLKELEKEAVEKAKSVVVEATETAAEAAAKATDQAESIVIEAAEPVAEAAEKATDQVKSAAAQATQTAADAVEAASDEVPEALKEGTLVSDEIEQEAIDIAKGNIAAEALREPTPSASPVGFSIVDEDVAKEPVVVDATAETEATSTPPSLTEQIAEIASSASSAILGEETGETPSPSETKEDEPQVSALPIDIAAEKLEEAVVADGTDSDGSVAAPVPAATNEEASSVLSTQDSEASQVAEEPKAKAVEETASIAAEPVPAEAVAQEPSTAAAAAPTATEEEEPTFSILPIDVEPAPAEAVEAESSPAAAAAAPSATGEEEPTFSILPIEVIDDKGTPASDAAKENKIRHEEL